MRSAQQDPGQLRQALQAVSFATLLRGDVNAFKVIHVGSVGCDFCFEKKPSVLD